MQHKAGFYTGCVCSFSSDVSTVWELCALVLGCRVGWRALGICCCQGLIPVEEAQEQRGSQAVSRHCSKPVRIPLLVSASVSLQRRKLSWVFSWPCTEGQCDPSSAAKIPVNRSCSLFVSALCPLCLHSRHSVQRGGVFLVNNLFVRHFCLLVYSICWSYFA